MASSSSKRPRSEDDKEEETHHKKPKFDLNKEPAEEEEEEEEEEEIDLNKELQVNEEEEVNQNEEHNHIDEEREEKDEAAFALCHFMFLRDIITETKTEEEEEETEQQEKPSVLWLNEEEKQRWSENRKREAEKQEWIKRMKFIAQSKEGLEEDPDSDATLSLLSRWKIPAIPPEKIITRNLIEKCSEPIRKQMTKKRKKPISLGLSKSQVRRKFLPLLKEAKIQRGKDGIRVSVYGPDGKVHEMMMCLNEKKNELDLTNGWRKFVGDYELKENCDFVTVWMFRHKLSGEICLAIDIMRLSFKKQVSKRISEAVFGDSD